MTGKTTIEWTHMPGYEGDVWNPTTGCTRVSAGCDNCYAFALHDKRYKANLDHAKANNESSTQMLRMVLETSSFGVDRGLMPPFPKQYDLPFSRVQLLPERLDAPLRKRKPTCYFVDSMADLFHEDVPDAFLDRVFLRMSLNRRHRFLILTKRPERMSAYCRRVMPAPSQDELDHVVALTTEAERAEVGEWARLTVMGLAEPPPNIWLGTSVEDQRAADERIPHLLATPAAVRFISAEPLIGPVDLKPRPDPTMCLRCGVRKADHFVIDGHEHQGHGLDWVIVGGESGARARPMDLEWARSLVAQCRAAGVAPFVKQLGSKPRGDQFDFEHFKGRVRPDEAPDLRESHGRDMDEWPVDLRVREFPGSDFRTSSEGPKQEASR